MFSAHFKLKLLVNPKQKEERPKKNCSKLKDFFQAPSKTWTQHGLGMEQEGDKLLSIQISTKLVQSLLFQPLWEILKGDWERDKREEKDQQIIRHFQYLMHLVGALPLTTDFTLTYWGKRMITAL